MRSDPPVVDDLRTRHLERGQLVRASVGDCAVVETGPGTVTLATIAPARHLLRFSGAPSPAPDGALPAEGLEIPGRLRVDVVADGIVRVRYGEGDAVRANENPMVVGRFDPPTILPEIGPDAVRFNTPAASLEIELRPFRLRATRDDRELCAVGGGEKNVLAAMGVVWDTMNTGVCRVVPDGGPLAVECFGLRPREAIYGFGEKCLRLDKVGQTIDLNMVEAMGVITPRSYKNVPFFMSTSGYGVFMNHSARITCWVGSRSAADVQVAIEDDFLDYYLFFGSLEEILSRYTDVTGKGRVPPAWSFGYWQSKISYRAADETLDVVRRMRAADVPMDVLHLDTHWFKEDWYCDLEFDRERFPDPAAHLAALAELGVKVCLWQLPYIPEGCRLFDDLAAAGAFVQHADGTLYDVAISYAPTFTGRVGCIDWTHPAARRIYGAYLDRLFALGVRAIKVDFGEQAPLDGIYHDRTPGHRMHNLYPLLYNQAIAEITAEATGEHVIWARSAWAGSQRYPLHWGGDSSANWANMGPQIAAGLSFGMSGFQFWSQDIGGFFGQPEGALLIRWLQMGLFLSHARIHGMGDRELYKFDGDVLRIGREFLRLRYRLLPYLYGTAVDSVARSLPMVRPLVLAYQDDPSTWTIDDQWLLGDDLLVAPILDPSGRRQVYFPAGTWTDWWSGEQLAGGRWRTVGAPLDRMPLYLREGATVPLGPPLDWVGQRPTDAIHLRVAPFVGDGERQCVVPVDEERVPVRYLARSGKHQITVGLSRARFEVEAMGPNPPAIEVVRG
jgi:alpha-D-xyloside xylohydrolase